MFVETNRKTDLMTDPMSDQFRTIAMFFTTTYHLRLTDKSLRLTTQLFQHLRFLHRQLRREMQMNAAFGKEGREEKRKRIPEVLNLEVETIETAAAQQRSHKR